MIPERQLNIRGYGVSLWIDRREIAQAIETDSIFSQCFVVFIDIFGISLCRWTFLDLFICHVPVVEVACASLVCHQFPRLR